MSKLSLNNPGKRPFLVDPKNKVNDTACYNKTEVVFFKTNVVESHIVSRLGWMGLDSLLISSREEF